MKNIPNTKSTIRFYRIFATIAAASLAASTLLFISCETDSTVTAASPGVNQPSNFQDALVGTVKQVNTVQIRNMGANIANSGTTLYLSGNANGLWNEGDNAELLQWNNYNSQKWELDRLSGTQYRLKLKGTNLFLRAYAGDANSPGGTGWGDYDNVGLWEWHNWGSQKWYPEYLGDGRTKFKTFGYSLMAHTGGDGWDDGDNVFIHSADNPNEAFRWDIEVLEKVDSPSIVKSPSGDLLTYFKYADGNGNRAGYVFGSSNGSDWDQRAVIDDYYGPSLFTYDNVGSTPEKVYALLVRNKKLKLLTGSDDGRAWAETELKTIYKDAHYTPLSASAQSGGGAPVLITSNYIYYAFMDNDGSGSWPSQMRLRVASCPTDKDITDGANWAITNAKEMPTPPTSVGQTRGGWLEGNLVKFKGKIMLFARVDAQGGETIAALRLSNDRKNLQFSNQDIGQQPVNSTATGFMTAPIGGSNKFHIIQEGSKYWIMCNPHRAEKSTNPNTTKLPVSVSPHRLGILDANERYYDRNELALYSTTDFRTYSLETILLSDDLISDAQTSVNLTGFQQPSFIIDGSKIKYVSRTAYGTFDNYHDANIISYHEYTTQYIGSGEQ